jgi:hypothetical protein
VVGGGHREARARRVETTRGGLRGSLVAA